MFVGAEKRTNLNIPLLFILQQGMLFPEWNFTCSYRYLTQLMVFDTKVLDMGSWLLRSEFSSPQRKLSGAKSTRGYSHPVRNPGQVSSASINCSKDQPFEPLLDSPWCLACWWTVRHHKAALKTSAFFFSQLPVRIAHMRINKEVPPAASVCGETRSFYSLRFSVKHL